MFSGLTNQMSSWMGAVKGDEDAAQSAGEPCEVQAQPDGDVDQAQAAFENINVSGDGPEEDGVKATR